MKNNRVVVFAAIIGTAIVAVTYVGASRLSGDEKASREGQKILSPVKSGSRGVVVFGTVDVDNGAGLLPVFPEGFPQPCKVKKVHAVEGQNVDVGDLLLEFDSEYADYKVAEAVAGVAKARAIQKGAESMLTQAIQNDETQKLVVEAQRLTLKSKQSELEAVKIDLEEKKRRLGRAGAPMDPDVLAAEKKVEAAQQALDGEQKKLEALKIGNFLNPIAVSKARAEAGVEEAKSAVAVQEAQLQQAQYGQKIMTLKAPASGKIVRTTVTEGMSFGAQTRSPAFLMQTKGPIIVRAEIDQEFASRVEKGQAAIITDDGNPNLKWNGQVIRLSESFLPKRSNMTPEGMILNDARILECYLSIDVSGSNPPVRVGQRVKVSIGVE